MLSDQNNTVQHTFVEVSHVSKVVIFLGPPGAGKGTQAQRLAAEFNMVQLSTGSIIREQIDLGTPLGVQVKPIYDAGNLVPDDIMIPMVRAKLSSMDEIRVLFDGFPRTLTQAQALDMLLEELSSPINAVPLLEVPEDILLTRLLERAKKEGRTDDTPETIRNRFKVYLDKTQPLIDYYAARGHLSRIDGTGTPQDVYKRLKAVVS